MATFIDPESGLELNAVPKKRISLDPKAQAVARRLRSEGHKIQDIAAMLGTNQGRVQAALGRTGRKGKDQLSLF
ncbi:hypothetical protein SAMN05421774_11235 [Gemmobacter megaterium]|uniref:Helix-turn-helix domain-containing protein n=1 Tax=Gemmobacter megaterium TaxID=1086013 RepID=A0A1N7QID4_9RHOB|nr:hypothetical protein [Gemmobacter megaterium]GGE26745.1 hypothetical protein GCM10011345_35930 [Gemmobacter megaterium]SIT22650.1 hypothetical protein SAMN05421774_11235 [Gemmobacter megaterium]